MIAKLLSWSLVIPTYQREAVLLRCLGLAASQTYPPKEIIVVDGSPEWQQTRQKIQQQFVPKYPKIRWQYVQAKRLSSSAQRNQGIELNTADIIFLIDDDSLMYPNCAEKVLHIYTTDTEHQVAGIMPFLSAIPPDQTNDTKSIHKQSFFKHRLLKLKMKLRGMGKRFIKDNNIFIPYDFKFYTYPLPKLIQHMPVHCVPMMHGARMSYRKEILQEIRFEETLERYAVNEDNDVCYRASRCGLLLQALDAKICHLQAHHGRLSRFATTALWGLNQVVLHHFHSADLEKFKQQFVKLLWRRIFTQTLKDFLDGRWLFPSTQGAIFALRHYQIVLSHTSEDLKTWYPKFQQKLIEQDQRFQK